MTPRKKGTDRRRTPGRGPVRKRACHYCTNSIPYVDYKDVAQLRTFVSDRGRIRPTRITGNCPYHQRAVARAIKNAREMALMPYQVEGGYKERGGRRRR